MAPLFAASEDSDGTWCARLTFHPVGTSDVVHFNSAAETGRLLVSNDQDMLKIAARRQRDGMEFSGLIFWVPGKYHRVGDILRAFAATAAQAETNPARGRVKFL